MRFWDLETIGITPSQERSMSTGDSQILQELRDSYRIEEDRRSVLHPKEILELSPNRGTAERFRTLQKRLQQDDALWIIYEDQMLDHVVKLQTELAPTTENSTGVFNHIMQFVLSHSYKSTEGARMYVRGLSKKYPTFNFPAHSSDARAASLCTAEGDSLMRMMEIFLRVSVPVAAYWPPSEVLLYVFVGFVISMTERVEQRYCIKFCHKLGDSQSETIRKIQVFGDDAMGVTN